MPDLQTLITSLILAGAAIFLVRRIYNNLKKSNSASCGCSCSGCNATPDCQDARMRENDEIETIHKQ